jgi:hypothetical protein
MQLQEIESLVRGIAVGDNIDPRFATVRERHQALLRELATTDDKLIAATEALAACGFCRLLSNWTKG